MKNILFFLCLFLPYLSFSQGAFQKKRTLSDKFFFGGGIGLQLNAVIGIDVSPMIGYRINSFWAVGTKVNYQYFKRQDLDLSTRVYGASLFTTVTLFENVALYAEMESLNIEYSYFNNTTAQTDNYRYWIHSPLVGGGLIQPLGERSQMLLLLLWNFNETNTSPYSNPIVKLMFLY